MTLGELVEARVKIPGAASAKGLSELFALYAIEVSSVIRSLGIWDAEVLEGEYSGVHARLDGDLTIDSVPLFSDLDAFFQHNVMSGKREGRFRIIVLPKEE